jgi:hypothetical protein
MANEFIARKGIISLDDAQVTGSLSVTGNISASIFTGSFIGDGSQLSGVSAGFPFTGSAEVTGSLTVTGSVSATTFLGDGSQLTGIGSPIPVTATVNTGSSPLTLTTQSIVIADSTDGDITINLPDLDAIVGTSDQKPIIVYKNDYSQNVIYVQPSGSQLVNGASQDIIVSIQLAVIYNPTNAGWVTEGTSAQSLAELELFFVPRTETGSFATTGSNQFDGNQTITGSLTVTGGINATITGSATSASYVEYTDVANKPTLVSGSEQVSFNGITDKPALVSSSAQIVEYGIFATTGSNQFDGNQAITGSLTVTGQVVAQTLNVQQVTSSIVFSSGSNIFGNDLGNTQQFTGSVSVTGSLTVNGVNYLPLTGGTLTGALNGTSATFSSNLLANTRVLINSSDATKTPLLLNAEGNYSTSGNMTTGFAITNTSFGRALNMGIFESGAYGWIQSAYINNADTTFALSLQPRGGNVGIGTGTASPSNILSIRQSNASTATTIELANTSTGNNTTKSAQLLFMLTDTVGTVKDAAYVRSVPENVNVIDAALTFATRSSDGFPTERMRITSGGNIDISGGSVRTNGGTFRLADSGGTTVGGYFLRKASWLGTGTDHTPSIAAEGGYGINFYTNGQTAERMIITSDGQVLIGMTSNTGAGIASVRAGLFSGQRDNSIDPVFQAWNQGTSLDNQFVHFYTEGGGGTFRGSIDFNRGAGLVRYNTSSDYRLKSEIEDFNASEIILNLKPKKYRIGDAEQKTIGFIAHELQEYYPQAVSGTKDQINQNGDPIYQGVDYSQLTGLLVKAIQEQQSQIESLKAEIQTLKQ